MSKNEDREEALQRWGRGLRETLGWGMGSIDRITEALFPGEQSRDSRSWGRGMCALNLEKEVSL